MHATCSDTTIRSVDILEHGIGIVESSTLVEAKSVKVDKEGSKRNGIFDSYVYCCTLGWHV